MENIVVLFEEFAKAYRRSLFAIEQKREAVSKERQKSRDQAKKQFERTRSLSATKATNDLMANIHRLNEAYQEIAIQEDSVIKAAEYLAFGMIDSQDVSRLIFSDCSLPCVIPFLGHKNIYIESNSDACQELGLQFAIRALLQTAPGQLYITVINPELRPDFSVLTKVPGFKMLTRFAEIEEELASIIKEIIQNDTLLQGKYSSLVELRSVAEQPAGRLQLLVIQDLPRDTMASIEPSLMRVFRGGPRAGIAVLYLNSKSSQSADRIVSAIKDERNTFAIFSSGNHWKTTDPDYEKLLFTFQYQQKTELSKTVARVIEDSKKTSVITVPFSQIEDTGELWKESAAKHLIFNLGKAGLDTISICLGDEVSQHHNILISGAAGKGKSNLIEVIVHSLCTRYSPDELELFLLDFKDGLTFKPYTSVNDGTWLPHARIVGVDSDRDVGLAVLKDLEAERRRRAVLFGDSAEGVHDYESYRNNNPEKKLSRMVLIIDEYQKLFDINDDISEEASALLENLVRQGRACAIHIILASQSITGTAGLLGKEDRIYSQFPVRMALQNTVTESYSIFGIGNDSAAQLRVRGEAILNTSYGAIDANRKFTVAYAEPKEMKEMRRLFCQEWPDAAQPVVFTKKDTVVFSQYISRVKAWRQAVSDGSALRLPCGVLLSIDKSILSISLPNDTGRNVALLGAAEDLQMAGTTPGKLNIAVGMLQGFAISLALQHPNGDARFVMIDGLATDVRKNSNCQRWLYMMERFGFPVEVVSSNDAARWFQEFQQEKASATENEDTYVLGFGMDRCSAFSECDLSGESGASAFQEVLKYGAKGVHLLCWWSNISMYNNHIGFAGDGYLGTKILLRMDTDSARDILGPFINWGVRDNRAYIHDSTDLAQDAVVIPMLPLTDRVCGRIEAEVW